MIIKRAVSIYFKYFFLSLTITYLTGCAGTYIPQTPYEENGYAAYQAANRGDWIAAEESYARAAEIVVADNLGPKLESESLYNLGRIKKNLGKLNEGEEILKKSLEIEEKLSGPSSIKTGRRTVELAIVYYYKTKLSQDEIKNKLNENEVEIYKELSQVERTYMQTAINESENRLEDGVILLKRIIPFAQNYNGGERAAIAQTYNLYSEELTKINQIELAQQFKTEAEKLGFR